MMTNRTEQELRNQANQAAQHVNRPKDSVEIIQTKTRSREVEYRTGFLNLVKKTRGVSEKYVETRNYDFNGWILDSFTSEQYDQFGDKFELWRKSDFCILQSDGSLKVHTVTQEDNRYNIHQDFIAKIEVCDMTFSLPNRYTYSNGTKKLDGLLEGKSVYMLDVAHLNWRVDRTSQSYIIRDFPHQLKSETNNDGVGRFEYSLGEGLIAKLEMLKK